MVNKSANCVCKTCTCGRHKCPGGNAGVSCPFEGVTEYHTNFHTPGPHERTPNFKPVQKPLQGGTFYSTTENKEKFVPHKVKKQEFDNPQMPKKTWSPNPAKFEGATTSKSDFVAHQIEARAAKEKAEWKPTGDKLEGNTTTRTDYKAWTIGPLHRHEKLKYVPNPARFEGFSTQRNDFRVPTGVQRPKLKEPEKWVAVPEDRDFQSVNKSTFPAHQVTMQKVNKTQVYQPNPEKFQGGSCYNSDFKPWTVEKPAQRPPAVAQMTPESRDFGTTSKTSYVQPTNIERAKSFKPPQNPPPPSKFESATTQSQDFKAWPLGKPPAKVAAKYVPNPAPLDGASVYKETFTPKSVERHHREPPKYVPSGLKFEGLATHRADYQAVPIPKKYVHEKEKFVSAPDDRDFKTESKNTFTPKTISVCPVNTRANEPKSKGADGHLYYNGRSEAVANGSVSVA